MPLGGNTWVQGSTEKKRILTGNGIENWSDKGVSFITYVRINTAGTLQVKLKAKAAQACQLSMTIAGKKKTVKVNTTDFQWATAGEWMLKDTGYIAIQLSAVDKDGDRFADISDYELSGTAINATTAYVKTMKAISFIGAVVDLPFT
ncbi:DUF5077 domain-containing protein [Paraflavitalea speifideaquila]|uniref:DUF5077 domain-containing protein n=1 Tax=Paraflavitalea speifideaquila TaxID=3076558 RepID=UPI0028E455AC|nr:DUF5077 domain-containing protein [Paraflavitalea speifideiaquila]